MGSWPCSSFVRCRWPRRTFYVVSGRGDQHAVRLEQDAVRDRFHRNLCALRYQLRQQADVPRVLVRHHHEGDTALCRHGLEERLERLEPARRRAKPDDVEALVHRLGLGLGLPGSGCASGPGFRSRRLLLRLQGRCAALLFPPLARRHLYLRSAASTARSAHRLAQGDGFGQVAGLVDVEQQERP